VDAVPSYFSRLFSSQIVSRTLHAPSSPPPALSTQLASLLTSILPFTFSSTESAAASGAAGAGTTATKSAEGASTAAGGKAPPPTFASFLRSVLTPPFLGPDTLTPSDIVILTDPADARRRLLRRLAALPGAVLTSPTSSETLTVPPDHVWVERDAALSEGRGPWEGRDSRDFGPVRLASVVGRAIYCVRGGGDHGAVGRGGGAGGLGLADGLILGVELEGVLAAAASGNRREAKQEEKKSQT